MSLSPTALVLLITCAGPPQRPVTSDVFQVERGESALSVIGRNGTLLTYSFKEVPFKPYVKSLSTPSGLNVLRDAPHDHKHHHALMFAVSADGVSFWEESPRAGRQVHKGFLDVASGRRGASATVSFEESLDWVAPGEKGLLLRERRRIELYDPAAFGATLLSWSTTLRPRAEAASVRLSGHHYYGLGARFLTSMDKNGEFLRPGPGEGESVRGDERLTPGKWCAYVAQADGKPVTIAMFDHPSNLRKALWFTMGTPFAYLSATINLWREPVELQGGKSRRFWYGVAVWDGRATAETVDQLYRRWVALAKGNSGKESSSVR